jgi:hypothetical protein
MTDRNETPNCIEANDWLLLAICHFDTYMQCKLIIVHREPNWAVTRAASCMHEMYCQTQLIVAGFTFLTPVMSWWYYSMILQYGITVFICDGSVITSMRLLQSFNFSSFPSNWSPGPDF